METHAQTRIDIRRISAGDTAILGEFFEALAADGETTHFFHPHPLTRAFAAELCARQSQCKDRYYIALYHGRIAGYFMLRGWDEGYETPSFGGCTHPALRDAGLGQSLLSHAIIESRNTSARRLRLTVYKTNERAVHVYRKWGFAFSDKNEGELVGLLDLTRAVTVHLRQPDFTRLEAWLRRPAA